MSLKRNYNGLKKYKSLLQVICRVENSDTLLEKEWADYLGIPFASSSSHEKENYERLTEAEWEGCLGVACAIAVIEGAAPTLFVLSKHLDISQQDKNLQKVFDRLKVNGVFSNKYNLKKDPLLTGNGQKKGLRTASERERNAWCIIAGIASGFSGLKEEIKENIEEKEH